MRINSIDSVSREVTVTLNADELVKICNCMYGTSSENRNNTFHKLYGDMMLIRDLCQYGHIDNWCLGRIVDCRKKIMKAGEYNDLEQLEGTCDDSKEGKAE